MRKFLCIALATVFVGLILPSAPAQPPAGADRKIDAAERKAVIDGVLEKIEANYVFPDVGKKMAEAVRARAEKKEYDKITSAPELAETLTKHLREVCKDLHLGVRYSPEPIPQGSGTGPTAEEIKRFRDSAALRNFGFKKVERLGS